MSSSMYFRYMMTTSSTLPTLNYIIFQAFYKPYQVVSSHDFLLGRSVHNPTDALIAIPLKDSLTLKRKVKIIGRNYI